MRARPLLAVLLLAACAREPSFLVDLEGAAAFAPVDDPSLLHPGAPGPWVATTVPHTWGEAGLDPARHVGWYRLTWTFPEDVADHLPLALWLGDVGEAVEVWVDGRALGADLGQDAARPIDPPSHPRVYVLPGWATTPGPHVLTARVREGLLPAGLRGPHLGIGRAAPLLDAATRQEAQLELSAIAVLMLLLLTCSGALALHPGRRGWTVALVGTHAALAANYLTDSLLVYRAFDGPSWLQQAGDVGIAVLPGLTPFLLAGLMGRRNGRAEWWLLGMSAVTGAIVLLMPVTTWDSPLVPFWLLLAIGCLALVFQRSLATRPDESAGTRWLSMGLAMLTTCVVVESARPPGLSVLVPLTPTDLGVLAFQASLGAAVFSRLRDAATERDDLERALLTAADEERSRLALELHDGVGATLLAVKMDMQRMLSRVQQADARLEADRAISHLGDATAALRQLASRHHPPTLGDRSLHGELTAILQRQVGHEPIQVHVTGDEQLSLEPTAQQHVVRIAQEAVSNALRHGAPSRIEVTFHESAGHVHLKITDDGGGFDADRVKHGLGLRSMRERARLLGGQASIRSRPGEGTTVAVSVPFS